MKAQSSFMCEDTQLIKRVLSGEKDAFELIIQKYQRSLFNYISRTVGERELALDFTQEVFIKTYASLRSFRSEYKFTTWLFKIASNTIIDYWRKKKIDTVSIDQNRDRYSTAPPKQIADKGPSISNRFEIHELRTRIDQVLEDIPINLRELFVWRHINEFSYEEIAEIKKMPVGTVKNRVFQAKEMIRRRIKDMK